MNEQQENDGLIDFVGLGFSEFGLSIPLFCNVCELLGLS